MPPADLGPLILEAYTAAAEPSRWPSFLDRLREEMGAVAAGVFVQDVGARRGRLLVQVGGDAGYVERYHQHYSALNPWFYSDGPQSPPGTVSVGFDRPPFLESEYYRDFWRPQSFGPTLSSYFGNDGRRVEGLLFIKEHGDRFGKRTVGHLVRLVPWLQQAARIWQTVSAADALRSALVRGMDHVNYGIVVLDANRGIVAMNDLARELLTEADGLALARGEVVATGSCRGLRFADLVDECVRAAQGLSPSSGGLAVIERERSDHPLAVRAVPLPAAWSLTRAIGPAVLLLVADEGRRPLPDVDILQAIYSLSDAEAHVAVDLARGLSLDDIAEQTGRSKETIRTQLRAAFDKTGTARQTALASQVLTSLAALRRPRDAD